MQLKHSHLFFRAKARKILKDNTTKEEWALDFRQAAPSAYELGANTLLIKNATSKPLFKTSLYL